MKNIISPHPQEKTTLWIVTELYYPERTSTGYFLTCIAEGLASQYDVRVICGQPTYSELGMHAPYRDLRHGVGITRMKSTHFNKDKLILRAINALTFMSSTGWFLARHLNKGDCLLVVTNPPSLPPVAGFIGRLKQANTLLLIHDVYPEILDASGMLRPTSLLFRTMQKISVTTHRIFNHSIVLGRDMKNLIQRKTGLEEYRLHIIPNWGDIDEIKPLARHSNDFAIEHKLTDCTVLQFSGNIGRTHDIHTILEVARRLQHRTDLVFLFVGYGGKSNVIKHAIEEEKLGNVRFLPRQPRTRLRQMLACSDATIISFEANMQGLSVPSRMYNILAAGVPIIAMAEPESELSLMVSEHGAGWVISPGDVDALEEAAKSLTNAAGRKVAADRGRMGRLGLYPRYTLDAVIEQYDQLIRTASGQAPG